MLRHVRIVELNYCLSCPVLHWARVSASEQLLCRDLKTHCKVYPPDAPAWVCRPNTEQCYRNRSLCAGKTKKLGDKDINSNYKGCAKIKPKCMRMSSLWQQKSSEAETLPSRGKSLMQKLYLQTLDFGVCTSTWVHCPLATSFSVGAGGYWAAEQQQQQQQQWNNQCTTFPVEVVQKTLTCCRNVTHIHCKQQHCVLFNNSCCKHICRKKKKAE